MNKIQTFLQKIMGMEGKAPDTTPAPKIIPFSPRSSFGMSEPPPMDQKSQVDANRSWVYACVKRRADKVASIRLNLYERKNESEVEENKSHDVLDLLDRVNNFMTRYDLFEYTSMMWDLAGECFWWKIRDKSGQIISIYPYLMPYYMDVVPSKEEFVAGYAYHVPGTGETITFPADDIIHFKHANPTNPYRGLSPVKAAEYAISTDREGAKWNYNFFKNSARPDGLILYPGTMSEEKYQRMKTQWEVNHQGTLNAHKMAIIESGDPEGKIKSEFVETGFAQKDMDFIEQRKFSRDEIFVIFGVPKGIMIADDVNLANSKTHESIFIKDTIIPIYRKLVSYLNEFLLPDYDDSDSLFFDFEDPTIRDIDSTLKYYESGLKNGWLSPNEIREQEGYEGFEGGESVYMPVMMIPIGEAPEGKKSHPVNIIRQRRSKTEKIDNLVKNLTAEVKGSFSKIIKSKFKGIDTKKKTLKAVKEVKRKKESTESIFANEKQRTEYINNYVKRADREEASLRVRLRTFFKKQESRVIGTIGKKEAETKGVSIRFNIQSETMIAIKAFEPLVNGLIEEHGRDIMRLLGIDTFEMTTERIRDYLKDNGLKFAEEINKATKEKILAQIAQGTEAGESIDDITLRVKRVFRDARIERARIIARTEVARSSNFANVEAYKQSEVVSAKEWVTTPDERLCGYCEAMDGKIVGIDKNYFNEGDEYTGHADRPMAIDYGDIEQPPLHVACRCTTIPVLK